MEIHRTFQSELQDCLDRFQSDHGYPNKPVTLAIREQQLIAQYETKGGIPNIERLRKTVKELAITGGAGAAVAASAALILGRTFLGGALGRVGIAGAFGAIGMGALGPAVLIGGTVASAGYLAYKWGKSREGDQRAQAWGEDLLAHLKAFRPTSPPPNSLAIIQSSNRRITVIYDPEMATD